MSPAGLRWRAAAWLADALLLTPLLLAAAWPLGQRAAMHHAALQAQIEYRVEVLLVETQTSFGSLLPLLLRDTIVWSEAEALASTVLLATLLLVAIAAAWFIGFEASRWQATPGKRWLGLRVETLTGGAPGIRGAALRWLGGVASAMLLHLGHAMIGLRADHRALHDLLAGTRVVFTTEPAPRTLSIIASGLLALPGVAMMALLAWVTWHAIRLAALLAA